MIDFSSQFDLSLVAAGVIATAIFLYVLLDGFDLGVGILFPFAPSDDCRHKMMNSIAPFWDGNETWLVLGGGGLFATFPLAYSILLPAFYIPIILMLLGLIFRGVAFEFRFKATGTMQVIWDYSFHFGSLAAAFFQGVLLGAFVQGVTIENHIFAGESFEWLSAFSLMTGVALVFGYALLGSTWTILKTEAKTQKWARKAALYSLLYVALFMGLVSLWVPFIHDMIFMRWFTFPNIAYLCPIPFLTAISFVSLYKSLLNHHEVKPFVLSICLFILGFLGLIVSLWPWIVPYQISFWQASASPHSLSLVLLGVFFFLPLTLIYTAYSYYVFRGKSSHTYDEK